MYEKIKKILSNPVFVFLFTIALSLFVYWLSIEKLELTYAISSDEIIASPQSESPELTINWQGNPVTSKVRRFKIAIWNSGNKYIDKAMFSKSEPLRIEFEKSNSQILSHNVSSISRTSLPITLDHTNNEFLSISIDGDDGLEQGDGFVISIFYMGDIKPKINLIGRIKGINKKFTEIEWSKIKNNWKSNKPVVIMLIIFLILNAITVFFYAASISINIFFIKTIIQDYLAPVICISCLIMAASLAATFVNTAIYGLSWVI